MIKTSRSDPMFRDLDDGQEFLFANSRFRKLPGLLALCLTGGNNYHRPGRTYRFLGADHIGPAA
jgi:hypothetical protein